MAIPSQPTTAISLGPTNTPTQRSISNEFSDTAPHQLDQFRRAPGGSIPSNPANAGIPTLNGQPISFSQFNGATSAPAGTPVNYDVTASNNDFDLLRFATSPNRPAPTRYTVGTPGWQITFRIANNVIIGSQSLIKSIRLGSLTTNTSSPTTWHPDVTITINNQGAIVGAGGHGGDGGDGAQGGQGQRGGTALNIQRPVTIYNNPNPWVRISGGGGGGGGGQGFSSPLPAPSPTTFVGGSGGGGAGIANGMFGLGADLGQSATSTTVPLGVSANGGGGIRPTPTGAGGGYGGALGAAGAPAPQAPGVPAPTRISALGGAAGYYVKGGAQVTWTATGTRQGLAAPQQQAPMTTIQYQLIANSGVDLYTFATSPLRPAPTRYTALSPGYRLEFTIGPGVIIKAAAVGGAGITRGGLGSANFHNDNEIVIINQGYIVGGAGPGGAGRPAQPGQVGGGGGAAIINPDNDVFLIVQNQGSIRAGGGGGGASGGYSAPLTPQPTLRHGAGGGAGAGDVGPGAGPGQPGAPGSVGQPSQPGQPAPVIASPGQGGTTTHPSTPRTGGAGGDWGQPGQSGQPTPAPLGGYTGGLGGDGGVYGRGFIIWQELGTVQGQAQQASTVRGMSPL